MDRRRFGTLFSRRSRKKCLMPAAAPHATLTHVSWPEAFTPAEMDAIEAIGEGLAPRGAEIANKEGLRELERIRITKMAWITVGEETKWLYDRIWNLMGSLNEQFYQFDLRGFSDPFQYTIYRDADGGHYDWHVDQGPTVVQRKLSLTLQLSEPSQYEGCDLELRAGNLAEVAPRERGTLIAFPSYVLHRVTPIRSGTRKSLVAWISGPKFR
jgi:PKHD-type hydroxylase